MGSEMVETRKIVCRTTRSLDMRRRNSVLRKFLRSLLVAQQRRNARAVSVERVHQPRRGTPSTIWRTHVFETTKQTIVRNY
ncbi:hypothetical protein NY2A_b643R [Paramecium bursaria Chlorella virus NY2A]|uniref:Uncharacterized protein b643R n=1 Tax=Paramecium bursaria Chlorella virus NY2A TaxID=46021 RepID=A7IXG8_PBCVN|nr:hypothetical protein NY2A_b643R [Paramecium bursaria Chlorella virus NY2A]ABT15042.1 hypothetical protein NY2A_b643R [Paramecium bursaria Chlorella virus NY2A]